MQKTITIIIDSDDLNASARSLRDGLSNGITTFEEVFPLQGVRIDPYRSTDGEPLSTTIADRPNRHPFLLKSLGPMTRPVNKGKPKA